MEGIREQLIEYLESNDLTYIDRDEKISHKCISPEHEDGSPSAFTSLEIGNEFTHCSSCGFHLNTENLYKFLDIGFDEDVLYLNQMKNLLKSKEDKNKDKLKPIFLPIKEADFIKDYREISIKTFQKVGAFYTIPNTFYEKRIIIPMYDYENKLRSFEAVSTNKKVEPKILRPKGAYTEDLFGFENLINSKTVFLTEGIFNSLSLIECGYDSMFNFGLGSIKPKIKKLMLKGVTNVILCGDNDKAGRKWNGECIKALRHNFNVGFFKYPYGSDEKFDVNDLHKKYGSEKFKVHVDKILESNMMN